MKDEELISILEARVWARLRVLYPGIIDVGPSSPAFVSLRVSATIKITGMQEAARALEGIHATADRSLGRALGWVVDGALNNARVAVELEELARCGDCRYWLLRILAERPEPYEFASTAHA